MNEDYTNEPIKETLIKFKILELVKLTLSEVNYQSSPMETITLFDMIKDLINPNDCENSECKDFIDYIYKQTEEEVENVLKIQPSTN